MSEVAYKASIKKAIFSKNCFDKAILSPKLKRSSFQKPRNCLGGGVLFTVESICECIFLLMEGRLTNKRYEYVLLLVFFSDFELYYFCFLFHFYIIAVI